MKNGLKFARDVPMPAPMKVLVSIGIYLSLVMVLGLVLAYFAPREGAPCELSDDEA